MKSNGATMSIGSMMNYNYRSDKKSRAVESGYVRCADCKQFFTRLGLSRHTEKCRDRVSWNKMNLLKIISP